LEHLFILTCESELEVEPRILPRGAHFYEAGVYDFDSKETRTY
jgi:hypothetical protein